MKTVLVLGGYGNFGKRIVEDLATIPDISLLIAGRNAKKAQTLIDDLENSSRALLSAVSIDIYAENFETELKSLAPDIVIHTSGPFQRQSHRVPNACINVGSHYVDLADDRRFVCDIVELDSRAKTSDVLVVSGASSVPGLSSTVVDHYRHLFSRIHAIDIAIAPGNQAERGAATIKGILSYTGHPFEVFADGQWRNAFGWMDPRTQDFGDIVGKRSLANVDVPDLELFPERYATKNRVRFQAGLELRLLHYAMVCMAYLAKFRIVNNWAPLTNFIVTVSKLFDRYGTSIGGMRIKIDGAAIEGGPKSVTWTLYAPNGVGPYIPTVSALVVTKKLLSNELSIRGATPCVGLFTLESFEQHTEQFGIYCKMHING